MAPQPRGRKARPLRFEMRFELLESRLAPQTLLGVGSALAATALERGVKDVLPVSIVPVSAAKQPEAPARADAAAPATRPPTTEASPKQDTSSDIVSASNGTQGQQAASESLLTRLESVLAPILVSSLPERPREQGGSQDSKAEPRTAPPPVGPQADQPQDKQESEPKSSASKSEAASRPGTPSPREPDVPKSPPTGNPKYCAASAGTGLGAGRGAGGTRATVNAAGTTVISAAAGSGGILLPASPDTEIVAPYQRTQVDAGASFQGQFVVRLQTGASAPQVASEHGATQVFAYPRTPNINLWMVPAATEPQAYTAQLTCDPRVLDAYPVYRQGLSTRSLLNDPLLPAQWQLYNVGQAGGAAGIDGHVQAAWDLGATGRGVTIGIVDDGLQYTHPDLAAHYVAAASYDFFGSDDDPAPVLGTSCNTANCHGTAVAGVAAAVGGNAIGVSGVAPDAQLGGIRLVAGATSDSQEAQALAWSTKIPGQYDGSLIDIYNNSWGPADTGVIQASGSLVQAAITDSTMAGRGGLGSIYVWAGGNGRARSDNVNYDGYANNRHVIAVAAVNQSGVFPSYSEPGAPLLVAAPSDNNNSTGRIVTTDLVGTDGYHRTDYTDDFGGTSSAAPYVSGVIALMLQANPNLGWRDVEHILVHSATVNDPANSDWLLNGAGHPVNHNYGFGLVNAEAAVALARSWRSVGPELLVDSGSIAVSQAIPDNNPTGLTRTFSIAPNIRVEKVEVVFDATHPTRGDLDVQLTSPSGTLSKLAEKRTTDPNANYSSWVFSSARNWDESSAGTWSLTVRDLTSGSTGTWNSWQLRIYGTEIAPDKSGPRVVGVISQDGVLNGGTLSSLRVQLSEPIDVSSFTPGDVVLRRVGDAPISISSVTPVAGTGNTAFDLSFPTQSATGNYRLDIGPSIADVAGNLMNQDGDGTNGEASQDKYTEFFTLAKQFIFSNVSASSSGTTIFAGTTGSFSVTLPAVTISDLNVLMTITHKLPSAELRVQLSSPEGTSVMIANNNPLNTSTNGSTFTNGYLDTVLDDDEATAPVISATTADYHYTNRYRPSNPLSVFDGAHIAGSWTLSVMNLSASNLGFFKNFSLIVTQSPPDIRLDSVTNLDEDRSNVEVTYSVIGTAANPFDIGVFSSSDVDFNANSDTQTGTFSITAAGDLALGTHTIEISASQFPDPSFTANQELFSLVVIDPAHNIEESNKANNVGVLVGVTRSPDGTLYIAGDPYAADTITITNSTVTFANLNGGAPVSYSSSGINDVFVETGGGSDTVNAAGLAIKVLAMLGGGDDSYTGGDLVDAVLGGSGNDTLLGGPGNDRLYGMAGDDSLDGGAGDDLLNVAEGGVSGGTQSAAGGPGNDRFYISGTVFNDRITVWDPDGNPAVIGSTLEAEVSNPVNPVGFNAAVVQRVTIANVEANDLLLVIGGNGDDYIQLEKTTVAGSRVRLPSILVGAAGADTLVGGLGPDALYGDSAAVPVSGDGIDSIDATDGSGNDSVYCGSGMDALTMDDREVATGCTAPAMVEQDFNAATPPLNHAGDGYPNQYMGEGDVAAVSVKTTDAIAGNSLMFHVTAGDLYAEFDPYEVNGDRTFARDYAVTPAAWQFNTYNRLTFWIKVPTTGPMLLSTGQQNFEFGTYQKTVTGFDPSVDETDNNHWYHFLNLAPTGTWTKVVLNMHPNHRRGATGSTEQGIQEHPTGEAAYNYFDALTRFYIDEDPIATVHPRDYLLDEFQFSREPYQENEAQVYSVAGTYVAASNRLVLTWFRNKSENTVKQEVRYAFTNIHDIGWDAATPAPSGIITPPGDSGYNGMVYDTSAINLSGHSMVYLAIKPQNSNLFSQIALPLNVG